MGTTTIANSSTTTKNEIKDLAEDKVTDDMIGVTVAAYSSVVAVQAATEANADDIKVLQSQINDPDLGTIFLMSIADNTLTASISAVMSPTFVSYRITYDDGGATPTDGFTSSTIIPATYELPDWEQHTYYLWVQESEGAAATQIIPAPSLSNGAAIEGINLQANDTIPPDMDSVVFTVSDAGVVAITTIPTDSESGLHATPYQMLVDDAAVTPWFSGTAATISLPPRVEEYSIRLNARDAAGNVAFSEELLKTIEPDAAIGTIGFTSALYEHDEDTTPLTIGLTRSGGTGAASVTISTVDDTAEDGTHFTGFNGTTVSWGSGVNDEQPVEITIADTSSTANNQFFVEIDYGSGDSLDAVISQEVTRVILNASSATGLSGYQNDASTPYRTTVESENMTIVPSTTVGQTDDTWALEEKAIELSRWSDGAELNADGSNNSYGSTSGVDSLDIEAPYTSATIAINDHDSHLPDTYSVFLRCNSKAASAGDTYCHVALLRGVTSIGAVDSGAGGGGTGFRLITMDADMTSGADGYQNGDTIYFEGSTNFDGVGFTISSVGTDTFEIPNTDASAAESPATGTIKAFGESSLLNFLSADEAVLSTNHWYWKDNDTASNNVYIGAVGTYELRVYMQGNDFRFDKVVIGLESITAASLDALGDESYNSTDHNFGPDESTYQEGGATDPGDNPDNREDLPYPLPTLEQTIPVKFPLNGSTNQSTLTNIRATFTDMSGLQINEFTVTKSGSPISGSYVVGNNTVTFTPSTALLANSTYSVVLTGRVDVGSGVIKSIDNGTWAFTTIDSASATTLFDENFSGFRPSSSSDYTMLLADGAEAFNNPYLTSSTGGGAQCWLAGNCHAVPDPFNSGKGDVLEVKVYKDIFGIGQSTVIEPRPSGVQNDFFNKSNSQFNKDDIYFAMDIALPNGYVASPEIHMARLTGPIITGNTQISCRFQLTSREIYGTPDNAIGLYFSNADFATNDYPRTYYMTPNDPTDPPYGDDSPDADYYTLQRGQWHKLEMRIKLETSPGDGNGIMQAWFDGQLAINLTDVNWKDSGMGSAQIEKGQWSVWHGGNSQKFACKADQSLYFDNIILSDSPITH